MSKRFDDEFDDGFGEEDTTDATGPSIAIPDEKKGLYQRYDESRLYQQCLRCCGACCCVLVFLCVFSWILAFVYLAQPTYCFRAAIEAAEKNEPFECTSEAIQAERSHFELMPQFAKSLLWQSIAHHTEPYQAWYSRTAPPPPPIFK